jgi:hypothetical protein
MVHIAGHTGHFRKDGAVENTLFENDQITKQQDHWLWLLATNIRTHLLKQFSYPIKYWNYVLLINLKGVSS